MSDNSGIENILPKFDRNPAGRNRVKTFPAWHCGVSAILEGESLSPEPWHS
jgi:hypothetical protein